MHAVEYNKNVSFELKSYFLSRKLFQEEDFATLQKWDDVIVKLNSGRSHSDRDVLMNFLAISLEEQLMKFNVMSMNNVKSFKSRLKMYFTSRHISFQSIREVMIMSELRDVFEFSLQNLRSLIYAVLELSDDYFENVEIFIESIDDNA